MVKFGVKPNICSALLHCSVIGFALRCVCIVISLMTPQSHIVHLHILHCISYIAHFTFAHFTLQTFYLHIWHCTHYICAFNITHLYIAYFTLHIVQHNSINIVTNWWHSILHFHTLYICTFMFLWHLQNLYNKTALFALWPAWWHLNLCTLCTMCNIDTSLYNAMLLCRHCERPDDTFRIDQSLLFQLKKIGA